MNETITRLVLVDEDHRRRAAVTHALAGSNIHVEPYEDPEEIIAHWPRDGVLLVHDRDRTIGDLLDHMGRVNAWLPMVGFSQEPDTRRVVQAVLQGAIDYIAWPFEAETLKGVIADAHARAGMIGNAKLREAMARARIEKLSRREREVLGCVASGLSNRLIGDKLGISPRTVEIHRANMLHKMGAQHTSDAIRIAIEAALVA